MTMKRKTLIIVLALVLIASMTMTLIACNGDSTGDSNNGGGNKNGQIVKTLADLVDYGKAQYYNVQRLNYGSTATEEAQLQEKQTEEREDVIGTEEEWDNDKYYTFNLPYFDEEDVWVDDEGENTFTKIFCYSDPADFIERMATAAVDKDKMRAIVAYICREDEENREKGEGYILTKGTCSLIEDYNQLDEITNIYNDFDDEKTEDGDSDDDTAYGRTEEEWSDLANLKKRKMYGELFTIFGDAADQFARFAIEEISYGYEVLDSVMLPAYNNDANNAELDFNDYMREELFDYNTLSYMLAFNEMGEMDEANYTVEARGDLMTLYGYYYQYQKADYMVFADAQMNDKIYKDGVTEYQDFLNLSHENYFADHVDALRYRDYDHRQYSTSYRYSADFYKKYYNIQYKFQDMQEAYDREIYVGGSQDKYANGIGYAQGTMTYAEEMKDALEFGLSATLEISDVNYEYTEYDNNVKALNSAQRDWERSDKKDNQRDLMLKVKLEIQELKSQQYTVDHNTISNTDLDNALKYQIKSYSADLVSQVQNAKKDDVYYVKQLERAVKMWAGMKGWDDIDTIEEFEAQNALGNLEEKYVRALYNYQEDIGRNNAKKADVEYNLSQSKAESQIVQANNNWKNNDTNSVSYNIKTTLAINYQTYADNWKYGKPNVDEYFEDNLIKKTYSCGGTFEECKNDNGHANCSTEYDESWELSRIIFNNEDVMRHTMGQAKITMKAVGPTGATDNAKASTKTAFSKIKVADTVSHGDWVAPSAALGYKTVAFVDYDDVTLESGDPISEVLKDSNGDYKYIPKYVYSYVNDNGNTVDVTDPTQDYICFHDGKLYYYEFAGWFVDNECKWLVDDDEEFDYDVRIYAGYRVKTSVGTR